MEKLYQDHVIALQWVNYSVYTFFFFRPTWTVLELFLFSNIDDTVLHELQSGAEWGENSKQSYVSREIRWLPRSTNRQVVNFFS